MRLLLVCSMIWLVLFFLVLPFGLKMPEKVERGFADSSPSKHYLGLKLVSTLTLSIVLTLVYWYIWM